MMRKKSEQLLLQLKLEESELSLGQVLSLFLLLFLGLVVGQVLGLDVGLRLKLGPGPDRCLSASQIHGRRSIVCCSYSQKWPPVSTPSLPLPHKYIHTYVSMCVHCNNKAITTKVAIRGTGWRAAGQQDNRGIEIRVAI